MNLTSARGLAMLSYLPRYYEQSRVVRDLLQVQGLESDELRTALDSVLAQLFVRTATWGLDRWEQDLGLPPAPDQPESERRDRLVSRLRGTGTATIAVVKQVAASYERGAVAAIEDHAAYVITIRFIDTLGIPPNLDDLKAALRSVLPAHLDIQYQFSYNTVDDLAMLTVDQLATHTVDGLLTDHL